MDNSPCEYCGAALPFGVNKPTRRLRSHHFQNCSMRPQHKEVEQPRREWVSLTEEEIKNAVLGDLFGGSALMSMMRDGVTVAELRQAVKRIARAVEAKLKERNHE